MYLQHFSALARWLIAPVTHAQDDTTLIVTTFGYGGATWSSIVASVLQVMKVTILSISSVVFVAGAGLFIISGANEGLRNQGKNMMIGSLIGLAIVIGGQGILNTIMYFIYGN